MPLSIDSLTNPVLATFRPPQPPSETTDQGNSAPPSQPPAQNASETPPPGVVYQPSPAPQDSPTYSAPAAGKSPSPGFSGFESRSQSSDTSIQDSVVAARQSRAPLAASSEPTSQLTGAELASQAFASLISQAKANGDDVQKLL